ncbi:MAG TPA: tyrosine-type recombinase/integrase [Acidimicrobiia bacterium]|nr:tyrosine-type recombinase/integrase [Acidimicrobiia bacterium]
MRTKAAFPGAGVGVEPGQKGMTLPAEILTPDEVLAIMAQRPDTVVGIRDRAIITVLYRAGLRVGEALALQPKDVDLGIGSITVLHGKGDRRRTVGIDPGAAPHIERWIAVRRDQLAPPPLVPLFCSRKCRPMSRSMVGEMLARSARTAGIDKRVHPHGFRHTMAYELLMEGVPIPVIQRQLGHASLQTTDTYLSHIAPKQVLEFMNARSWGGS